MCQVFGPHVTQWINASQATLCGRCKQIESNTYAAALMPERTTEEGE